MEYLCKNTYDVFIEPRSNDLNINVQIGEMFKYIKDKLNIDELEYRIENEVKGNFNLTTNVSVETKNKLFFNLYLNQELAIL